jgi:hypothetical protein
MTASETHHFRGYKVLRIYYFFDGEDCGVGVGVGLAKTIGAAAIIPLPS